MQMPTIDFEPFEVRHNRAEATWGVLGCLLLGITFCLVTLIVSVLAWGVASTFLPDRGSSWVGFAAAAVTCWLLTRKAIAEGKQRRVVSLRLDTERLVMCEDGKTTEIPVQKILGAQPNGHRYSIRLERSFKQTPESLILDVEERERLEKTFAELLVPQIELKLSTGLSYILEPLDEGAFKLLLDDVRLLAAKISRSPERISKAEQKQLDLLTGKTLMGAGGLAIFPSEDVVPWDQLRIDYSDEIGMAMTSEDDQTFWVDGTIENFRAFRMIIKKNLGLSPK